MFVWKKISTICTNNYVIVGLFVIFKQKTPISRPRNKLKQKTICVFSFIIKYENNDQNYSCLLQKIYFKIQMEGQKKYKTKVIQKKEGNITIHGKYIESKGTCYMHCSNLQPKQELVAFGKSSLIVNSRRIHIKHSIIEHKYQQDPTEHYRKSDTGHNKIDRKINEQILSLKWKHASYVLRLYDNTLIKTIIQW